MILFEKIPAPVIAFVLVLAVGGCLELGRRLGLRALKRDPNTALSGVSTIDGAIFALLGLIIAFTFSGAAARFDLRKQLIIQEANAIGTAYLRVDMLPATAQPAIRTAFRKYVASRIDTYRKFPESAALAEIERSKALQKEIWTRSVVASRTGNYPPAAMLLLPALNEMIDITTTRFVNSQIHPPTIVFALLLGLSMFSAVAAGYGTACSKRRKWIHLISFLAVIAISIYVILDMEYPRMGWIRMDEFDQVLVQTLKDMN